MLCAERYEEASRPMAGNKNVDALDFLLPAIGRPVPTVLLAIPAGARDGEPRSR